MAELIITNRKGEKFTVLYDDDLAHIVLAHRWHVTTNEHRKLYRPRTRMSNPRRHETMVVILYGRPPEGMVWDHINGNTLDNRRQNLRHATHSESCRNRRHWGKTSPYRGVFHRPDRRKHWRALIRVNGVETVIGNFDSAEDAARAYDSKARELHGVFARLNFPDSNTP